MLDREKYMKFAFDILEDLYVEIKFLKTDAGKDYNAFENGVRNFIVDSDFQHILKKVDKADPETSYKAMKKIVKSNFKALNDIYEKTTEDEFLFEMIEFFNNSQLKEYFLEGYDYEQFINELIDAKYAFIERNFLKGPHAEKNEDIRELMQVILKKPEEVEFIDKKALVQSGKLKTFALHILAKERDKAVLLNDVEKIRDINEIKQIIIGSDKDVHQDFKGGEEGLHQRITQALNEDLEEMNPEDDDENV